MKTYLKNKRAYARKRGYLKEKTNQKQGRHDDDEEDEEGDEGYDDDDEEDGEEEDTKLEEDDYGWNRGDGWGAESNNMEDDE